MYDLINDRPATHAEAMSEFARNVAHEDDAQCYCRGSGWTLTNYDVWVRCPAHPGRVHPEVCDHFGELESDRTPYTNDLTLDEGMPHYTHCLHNVGGVCDCDEIAERRQSAEDYIPF